MDPTSLGMHLEGGVWRPRDDASVVFYSSSTAPPEGARGTTSGGTFEGAAVRGHFAGGAARPAAGWPDTRVLSNLVQYRFPGSDGSADGGPARPPRDTSVEHFFQAHKFTLPLMADAWCLAFERAVPGVSRAAVHGALREVAAAVPASGAEAKAGGGKGATRALVAAVLARHTAPGRPSAADVYKRLEFPAHEWAQCANDVHYAGCWDRYQDDARVRAALAALRAVDPHVLIVHVVKRRGRATVLTVSPYHSIRPDGDA